MNCVPITRSSFQELAGSGAVVVAERIQSAVGGWTRLAYVNERAKVMLTLLVESTAGRLNARINGSPFAASASVVIQDAATFTNNGDGTILL